jgi:hypothetical protein
MSCINNSNNSNCCIYRYIIRMPDAPMAASGDNVYVTWWNPEKRQVMFRVSHDNGKTFDDKINLSNTPTSNSVHSDTAASGDNVYVSFHDNKTRNVDTYVRASNDNGATFGPVLRLSANATIGSGGGA